MSSASATKAKTDSNVEKMLRIKTIVSLGALLPGAGCYFCIAYTYMFQFERVANFTQSDQCPDVHSVLPPVSYSIGVWQPQKFIWLMLMFIHMPLRVCFILLYRRMFLNAAPKSRLYRSSVWFYMKTLWLEAFGLTLVSVVDIHSHFAVHALAFAIWVLFFNMNMFFNLILHHYGRIRRNSVQHEYTFRIKVFMFSTGVVLSLSTAVSYPIFFIFCSKLAYMLFTVAEICLVGYNSVFYCLAYWDFPKHRVTLGIHTGPNPKKINTVSDSVEKNPI